METIFNYKDYKSYLKYRIYDQAAPRGIVTRMAEAAGCQRTYLSQVLTREVHLLPEHGLGLCEFWGFLENETDFFMLLLQKDRAGTMKLKNHIDKKLKEITKNEANLKERYKDTKELSEENKAIYYSNWIYSAVHILTSIEEFQSIEKLASRLEIAVSSVEKVLNILERMKLVSNEEGRWVYQKRKVHVPKTSPMAAFNNANWRQRGSLYSQQIDNENVHYTVVASLAQEDFLEIRQMILKFIDEKRKVITQSKQEDVACFTLDWFWV